MIAKTYILDNLNRLDALYTKAVTAQKSLFFSKLAIIELCGWIEVSMDDIVLRCARRNLSESANVTFVQNSVVKRTYGFEYDQHFRKMLMQIIGLKHVEKLESKIDTTKFQKLKATLATLKPSRDGVAHTYLKGVTTALDAPSLTKARWLDIYEGLKEVERVLGTMSL